MRDDFRRIFYSNLLTVLLIIANLVGIKFTNYYGLTLSVNFIIIPFIFMCFLLIRTMYSKRDSINAVISGVLVQLVITFMYIIITNLDSQKIIPDLANSINLIFRVDVVYIITNVVALIIGFFVLGYIYEYFKLIGYRFLGTVLSFLAAIILYGVISIPINNCHLQFDLILHMILCHIIITVFMSILVACLFYILKDREYPYYENQLFIQDLNRVKKEKRDKSISEILGKKEKIEKKTNNSKNVKPRVTKKKVNKSKPSVKK